MPPIVNVKGPVTVRVNYGSGLVVLGFTRDGVMISSDGYFLDVPGDENGGDQGPPIEIQYLGETARVRIELTKFDPVHFEYIESRVASHQAIGSPAPSGTLMFAGGGAMSLVLDSPSRPRRYPRAIPRAAIELNAGTRYSVGVIEFECHKSASGVLWDNNV